MSSCNSFKNEKKNDKTNVCLALLITQSASSHFDALSLRTAGLPFFFFFFPLYFSTNLEPQINMTDPSDPTYQLCIPALLAGQNVFQLWCRLSFGRARLRHWRSPCGQVNLRQKVSHFAQRLPPPRNGTAMGARHAAENRERVRVQLCELKLRGGKKKKRSDGNASTSKNSVWRMIISRFAQGAVSCEERRACKTLLLCFWVA